MAAEYAIAIHRNLYRARGKNIIFYQMCPLIRCFRWIEQINCVNVYVFCKCTTFSRVILARIERAKKVRFCGFIKVSREQIIKNFEIVRLTSNFLTMLDRVLVTPDIN